MLLLATQRSAAQADTIGLTSNCTIRLNDGGQVRAERIWSINDGRLVYLQGGSLHDLPSADIHHLRCDGLSYSITNDTLRALVTNTTMSASPAVVDSTTDLRALGRSDAQRYFSGGAGFTTGLLLSPTIIVPLVVAAVPPGTSNPKRNPNAALYDRYPEYRKGYRGQAHTRKAGMTIGGLFLGILFILALSGS